MTDQTDRELTQKLRAQLQECAGFEGDQISTDRVRALEYYFQRPRGDEVRGRSNVVTGDLSAMVEANLAQMLESFSSANIAEFDATGANDDDQAELESAAVINVVMKQNNGHQTLGTAVKDALLQRNGFIKIWSDESRESATIELENATPEAIAEIGNQPGLELVLKEFDAETGHAVIRVTITLRKLKVEPLAPENACYLKNWHSTDLQEIPFFAERHVEARSELQRRGFPKKKVNMLKAYTTDGKIDSFARDVRSHGTDLTPLDKSQELIEWYECYALMDAGDGSSERHRIALAGQSHNSILENIPVSLVPYATGSAFINSHRLTGISLFDKLRMTQDLNTGLTRALMDNVNTVIKNRTAYLDGKVNVDDLADGRPNGNIRVRASVGNVNNAITSFQQQDLSGGILANLDYQRQVRTELGGASLELASGQMQMAGGRIGSEGVDRAFSVMEMLASHMTKNLAHSMVRDMFLLTHATLREHFATPMDIKINGRWETMIPAEWDSRTSVTVKIGMSPGERSRKVAAMGKTLETQLKLSDQGMDGVLVDKEKFYKALTDWSRLAEIPNPEQYWIDPMTPEAQKAFQAKQQSQQAEVDANKALMNHAVGLEQLRTAFDKYKADQTTAFNYWKENLEAQIEEAKIVGKVTGDLIKAKEKPTTNGSGKSETDD